MLKIIHVHNYYQNPGGEDTVFAAEVALLQSYGHEVITYTDNNKRIQEMNPMGVAIQALWSKQAYNKIDELIQKEKPDVVHFHNTFPLISPSGYYACRANGVPVVQSLDNPRLICPAATFYRNGKLCQDCLGKTPPMPGIIHGCYHGSRLQTTVIASMLTFHRWINTWNHMVDAYLVATEFYRRKFIEGGLPEEKIIVKPHFTHDNSKPRSIRSQDEYVLFIGRLDPEKGIRTLLKAWKGLNIPLIIRGDGQLEQECRDFLNDNQIKTITIVDRILPDELSQLIINARFLIWPSEGYYETFGMVAVECFSYGIPVLASDIGVMAEIVKNGETGLLFTPGDSTDLATKAEWLWGHPEETARLGRNARHEYEKKYRPESNYKMLLDVYSRVMTIKK
jgi:glycosyltransferase involved in cell wall biosynthesis